MSSFLLDGLFRAVVFVLSAADGGCLMFLHLENANDLHKYLCLPLLSDLESNANECFSTISVEKDMFVCRMLLVQTQNENGMSCPAGSYKTNFLLSVPLHT